MKLNEGVEEYSRVDRWDG